LRERTGADVGVVVTDSFGRPWRAATTDVAIGAAGVEVVRDLMGERDPTGYELHATRIAVADEIAGAAQLVFGKLDRVPSQSCVASTCAATAAPPRSSSRPRRICSARTP
jgi:coenzyme F420-0:L-glutamate ligase/coenzyme F420-1:gamma-L-glutamate ligase